MFCYDLKSQLDQKIIKNVNSFSYNGQLWLQNDTKLLYQNLDSEKMYLADLETDCNRLLGATETRVFFETSDGLYCYKISDEKINKLKTENKIFVSASDNKVLFFNEDTDSYVLEALS